MTDTRDQIRAHVRANAGIHFNELVRETTFAPGQIQYHVRRLIDDDELVREECYGQTHYYPPQYDDWERAALALFRRETVREIVLHLLDRGPSRPGAVADELGIARSTLEHHLDHLTDNDIVAKEYGERNRVTLSLVAPERTVSLLTEISPTVPDRLLDRFTRLVDGLLEDAASPPAGSETR